MRWKVPFGLLIAVAGISSALSIATATATRRVAGARIKVAPSTGGPTTRFVVSFRAPARTGRFGSTERRYTLSATGPTARRGCVWNVDAAIPPTRAQAHVRVTLDPRRLGGTWCAGTFRGQVEEIEQPVCPPHTACPAYVLLLGTVGKLRFSVRPRTDLKPPTGDTVPPTFGGLKSAFACTPGAQYPGETTPFNLTWDAAADNETPASQIVYDIYMSTTSGTEDFSKPTWTTGPGATRFRTPGLPSHGTFYFVVRARDAAGNEDGNHVERRGEDPCV
jgi:hypothetical protein